MCDLGVVLCRGHVYVCRGPEALVSPRPPQCSIGALQRQSRGGQTSRRETSEATSFKSQSLGGGSLRCSPYLPLCCKPPQRLPHRLDGPLSEWGAFRDAPFDYKQGESWDRLWHQGVHLLEKFARDDRVRVPSPERNLQVKILKSLPGQNEFIAYLDAVGELDGKRCLMDWKTTASRYPESPEGLLSLDPQLVCYSWISGIPDVAMITFLRKSHPEIQYLKAFISDEQRSDYGRTVGTTIQQIESAQFPLRSGIRFPQNGCTSCAHLGLCLNNPVLVTTNLVRKPGSEGLEWLDDIVD
jgi:hypothetical protein